MGVIKGDARSADYSSHQLCRFFCGCHAFRGSMRESGTLSSNKQGRRWRAVASHMFFF